MDAYVNGVHTLFNKFLNWTISKLYKVLQNKYRNKLTNCLYFWVVRNVVTTQIPLGKCRALFAHANGNLYLC